MSEPAGLQGAEVLRSLRGLSAKLANSLSGDRDAILVRQVETQTMRTSEGSGSASSKIGPPLNGCAAFLVAAMALAARGDMAPSADPDGVWLIDRKAAVEIYDCAGLICGRIVWLYKPVNAQGHLDRDKHNPDPALRDRELCGLTMLWNLHSDGANRWKDGWFYNPDDGGTYRVSAQLKSDDLMVARIYQGIPLIGRTKTLARVAHGVSTGWC